MMELTEQLIAHLAIELCGTTSLPYLEKTIELAPPWRRATMSEVLEDQIGTYVDLRTPIDELRRLCDEYGVPYEPTDGSGKLILELYEKTTEPELWGPVFVTDYPQE